jgi:hypothetical protein
MNRAVNEASGPPHTVRKLACQSDPERWFDRRNRAYALVRCLACPIRSRCAAEALESKASFGMWAGIWIDDNLTGVAHYLHAIAKSPAAQPKTADPEIRAAPPPAALPGGTSTYVATPVTDPELVGTHLHSLSPWVAAEVRSSGHCEVMAPSCRYSLDEIRCRVAEVNWRQAGNASALYAACRECSDIVANLAPGLAKRLGYAVEAGAHTVAAPFYWRQARWVLLGPAGQLCQTTSAA